MKAGLRPWVLELALMFAGTGTVLALSAWGMQSETKIPSAKIALADLSWLAGHWINDDKDGELLEETWMEPSGPSMLGMFRWLKNGKVYLYEMLAIEQRGEQIQFLLRHFNQGLVPWDNEKAGPPVTMTLTASATEKAVFESAEGGSKRRITFARESESELEVILESGDNAAVRFQYRSAD